MNFRDMVDSLFREDAPPEKRLERKIQADGHAVNEIHWDTPRYKVAPVLADCTLHLVEAKELELPELEQLAQVHFDACLEEYRRRDLP